MAAPAQPSSTPPVCQFSDRLTTALNAAQEATGTDTHAHHHHTSSSLSGASSNISHAHDNMSHDHGHFHDHGSGVWTPEEHGHTHEHLEHAGEFGTPSRRYHSDWSQYWMLLSLGKFAERDMPDYTGRNWTERAFTVGIGGCVSMILMTRILWGWLVFLRKDR